jgi:hypothetical protein
MALRTKLKIETGVFFMILRSKIIKNSRFQNKILPPQAAKGFLYNPKI